MPELPDIVLYLEQLAPRVLNQTLERVVIRNPFVLRSFDPPIGAAMRTSIGYVWMVDESRNSSRGHW